MKQFASVLNVLKFHVKTFKEDNELFLIWVYLAHMVVSGSIPLIAVIIPKYIIDAISLNDLHLTILFIILYGGLSLLFMTIRLKLMFTFEGHVLASRVRRSETYNQKFRHAEFKHLEDKNFHKKRDEAFNTMEKNHLGFQGTLSIVFYQMAEIFSIIGFTIILGLFNPWIIVVAVFCALLQFFIALKAKKFAIEHHEEYAERNRLAQYYYSLAHDFSYGKDIRINDLSESLNKRYTKKVGLMFALFKEMKIREYRFNLVDVFFLLITNGLTYYLVINAYFAGEISLGTIAMTIMTVTFITFKLQVTFKEVARLREETAKTQKYIDFYGDNYLFEDLKNEGIVFKEMKIEFKNVYFRYPGSDNYALKNVSFKIDDGKKMALVGINGSGKSTIVKLLCGLYKPERGEILINGRSLNNINIQDYRNSLAVVFQEVNIYAASVVENITGENPSNIEVSRALNALKKVGLYDKIMQFKDKENQQLLKVIDENGTDLSGGETQKLAIARAIYKENTKMIILDEPTASLDAIAEKEIYEHFNELVEGRTAIMISHRLASTKFCDFILFLENGEILERGSHEELMNKTESKYKEMFITQGKYYKEDEEEKYES